MKIAKDRNLIVSDSETGNMPDIKCFQNQQLYDALKDEYCSRSFSAWGPIFVRCCSFFVLINILAAIVVTGALYTASLSAVAWAAFICARLYANTLKNKMKARILFGKSFLIILALLNAAVMYKKDLSCATFSDSTSTMQVQGIFFLLFFYIRVSSTPRIYRNSCIAVSVITMIKIYTYCEFIELNDFVLFVFVIFGGEAFGHSVDAPRCELYILTQRSNIARVEEENNRAVAAEAMVECQKLASRQREEREKAEKHADSILNHNLKNVMADGIALIDLYDLTNDKEHLNNAKLSMKRGIAWTSRRQALILLCDKKYERKEQEVDISDLISEVINGRDIDIDFGSCSPELNLVVDPILISLALENGVSNALKHRALGSERPLVCVQLSSSGEVLKLSVQNKAGPNALKKPKNREGRLMRNITQIKGRSPITDGIGYAYARVAAESLGGSISLQQIGNTITYTLRTPIKVRFNNSLCTKPFSTFIEDPENVTKSKSLEATRAILIDDSKTVRKFAEFILMPKILGMKHWMVLGETREECEQSVSLAEDMDVDIVIIDENLDYDDCEYAFTDNISMKTGSDICAAMSQNDNIDALLCIRSGNTSPDDVKRYVEAGAHFVICKAYNNRELGKLLLDGYRLLHDERIGGLKEIGLSRFPILLLT